MTADQPDWQSYQSSNGAALFRQSGGGPLSSGTVFTGPWRSVFLNATITGGTGTWRVRTQFSLDAANTQVVYTNDSIVGNGVPRIGWMAVVAQYVTITATLLVPSAGDTISVTVAPSLLDSPQASRIVTTAYLGTYETVLTKLTTFPFDAAYSMPGPAVLSLRSNQSSTVWDLKVLSSAGTFTNLFRYQIPQANLTKQYQLTLPDAPIRLQATNFEPHNDSTFDIALSPS